MTCASCGKAFAPNQQLAVLPEGGQIAFDAERGRVWQVCGCGEWNLVGAETSARAIPELLGRFDAGAVQYFETLTLSHLTPSLELTRITGNRNALVASGAAPPRWRRDDIAAGTREKEINQRSRTFTWIFRLNIAFLAIQIAERVGEAFTEGDPVAIASLGVAVVLWIGVLYLLRRVLTPWLVHRASAKGLPAWDVAAVDTPILAAPRGQSPMLRIMHHFTTVVVLSLLLRYVNIGKVPSVSGMLGWAAGMIWMWGATMTGLSLIQGDWRSRPGRQRLVRHGGVALVGLVLLFAVGTRWPALYLVTGLLIPLASLVLHGSRGPGGSHLGMQLTYRDRNNTPVSHPVRDGYLVAFDWTLDGALTVHGLPEADEVHEPEASKVLRTILTHLHLALPPEVQDTRAATALLRSVGGGRGLLHALEGFRQASDGRVRVMSLPPVYRVALDLALAVPHQVPRKALEREIAAEEATDLAREAELLDGTT